MTRLVFSACLLAVVLSLALTGPARANGGPEEPTPVPLGTPLPPDATPTVTPLWPTATPSPAPTWTPAPPACPDPFEPNDRPDHGALLMSGEALSGLTLSPLGDVDFFRLYGKAGQFYRITSHSGQGLDTRLRLFDPAGSLLAENDDSRPDDPAAQIVFQAPGDGFLTVAVDSAVPAGWGCRTYHLQAGPVAPPTAAPPPTATPSPAPTALPAAIQPDPFEPNYDPAHAASLGVGQRLTLNFNPDTPDSGAVDNDFFQLYAKAGQRLQIETSALAPGLDTNLILYAADGVTPLAGNDDCGPGQLASCLTWEPAQNQLVYLLVGPVGALPETVTVGARTYSLSVTDLSGRPTPAAGQMAPAPAGPVWPSLPTATPTLAPSATPTPKTTPTLPSPPRIEIRALPSGPATPTPRPAHSVTIGLSVYYDQNNNRAPDIDEGVAGVSVRLLDSRDNRLLAHVLTDAGGFAAATVAASDAVRVSVPYLGFNQTVRPPGETVAIRLAPLRLPSLIP